MTSYRTLLLAGVLLLGACGDDDATTSDPADEVVDDADDDAVEDALEEEQGGDGSDDFEGVEECDVFTEEEISQLLGIEIEAGSCGSAAGGGSFWQDTAQEGGVALVMRRYADEDGARAEFEEQRYGAAVQAGDGYEYAEGGATTAAVADDRYVDVFVPSSVEQPAALALVEAAFERVP